jgi:hypothetical protein
MSEGIEIIEDRGYKRNPSIMLDDDVERKNKEQSV